MKTKLFSLLAMLLLAGVSLSAQTLGDVTGVVTDPQGAPITGANVLLTNTATNANRTVTTNSEGLYAFPALLPGTYTVKIDKPGFKTYTQSNVEVQVQGQLRVDVAMQLGQVSETVEVTASAASLNTENATVGTVVEQKRIVELPLNGRNYLQLTALAPNVSFGFPSAGQADGRQGGDRANQNISVAGARGNFNRFTLDGVENTDPNFNTYVIFPSAEALQEFKVQSGVYPAEFGRGATQINVSTKGGGNQFHGSLYEFLRNEKMDAKNYFFAPAGSTERPKDPFKWNQFGFVLSGPVTIPKLFNGKNRLFFMTNYEWFRQRRNVIGQYQLPSAAQRTGDFSGISTPIYDPATRALVNGVITAQQFPGNRIPTNRINAVSQRLLEFYPAPNSPGTGNNHFIALGRPINKDQFIQRFDFVESSNSNWFGRYSKSDENQLIGSLFQNGEAIITDASQWTVTNTRVITSNIVNEFRFGLTKFYNTTGPELAFTRDVVGSLGIPGLASGPPVQWGIPNVSLQGVYSGFGNSSEGPYENNNRAIQFINNLSWIRGKHTIKFGGEIRNDQYNQVGNQFARGQFTFDRPQTALPGLAGSGDPFAGFLLGTLQQSEAAVSIAQAQFRATGFAFYVDDTWRLSRKLTLNLGLRYENTPPWTDQTGTLFNAIVPFDVDPQDPFNAIVRDQSQHPYFLRQGAPRQDCYEGINLRWVARTGNLSNFPIQVRCDGSLGDRLVARDNNDWAPRIGAAYQLNEKTVIRAGVGMFYSQDTGNPRFDMARNLAGRLRANPNPQFPDLLWQNSLASIAGGTANVVGPYSFANPYNRRTPRTLQYLFNVQREFGQNLTFEIGYLGSTSRRLESLRASNEAVPVNPALSALTVPERSPFPEFGRIQLVDNDGIGNYNSLGMKLTKRYSAGLTALFAYTWSKSLDTSSSIRTQGDDTLFPQNSGCRSCEYGLSAFHTSHRFVSSILYDLPFGRGRTVNIENAFLNTIAGGWQLGGIFTLQSGFPFTVTNGSDTSNTGAFFDRPNATGQDPQVSDVSTENGFNTAAFARNAPGTYGNVGRNTGIGPAFIRLDFSTLKNFKMPYAESHNLQFRFEAFNLPNHPNWGTPNRDINNSNLFGKIRGTRGDMRNLQLALRYTF